MSKYYKKANHINNLIDNDYYVNLILLRNCIELACDKYFQKKKAPKIDLYLISREVSSPIGKGSDSLPLSIKLENKKTYLVDSAQFGMEPLVQKKFNLVYCYLPSFRGEDPDDRHLNQFYHCEAELKGDYIQAMNVAEELIKHIFSEILNLSKKKAIKINTNSLKIMAKSIDKKFPRLTFDEIFELFRKRKLERYIKKLPYGRIITPEGEKIAVNILTNNKSPIWITKYDRDIAPFYQMPDTNDKNKVLNADLIFPSIKGGFGGEVIGSGQRQNNADEMLTSMKRQGIKEINNYRWYLNLRKREDYKATSGFGLGIERLVAWILNLESIHDACVYPVIKTEFK